MSIPKMREVSSQSRWKVEVCQRSVQRTAGASCASRAAGDGTHGGENDYPLRWERLFGLDVATFYWGHNMLWTIFVVLLVLWALGMVSSYTLGGFIHILLLVALVVLVINLIQGRKVV
jgi:hypothetical protein